MTTKTYSGSCHCGAVRFEADIDFSNGTLRCNCSICTKARAWFAVAKPDALRLLSGADAQTEYQWVPPGRPGSFLRYRFCKTCGVRAISQGGELGQDSAFFAVSVAALDGVDPEDLASGPINYVDGRHGRFTEPPADTRFL